MDTNIVNDTAHSTPRDMCGVVLLETNIRVLEQLRGLFSDLEPQHYVFKGGEDSASIGMHMRHVLEFYQEFFKAPDAGVMSYDRRQRDLDLETDKDRAADALEQIITHLSSMALENQDLTLEVVLDTAKPLMPMPTTLHRELFYVLDHATHHMALIKLIAQQQEVALNPHFGMSQSTQAYQKGAS